MGSCGFFQEWPQVWKRDSASLEENVLIHLIHRKEPWFWRRVFWNAHYCSVFWFSRTEFVWECSDAPRNLYFCWGQSLSTRADDSKNWSLFPEENDNEILYGPYVTDIDIFFFIDYPANETTFLQNFIRQWWVRVKSILTVHCNKS